MKRIKDIKVGLVSYTKDADLTAFKVWLHSRPFIWSDLSGIGIYSMKDLDRAYRKKDSDFMKYMNDTIRSLLKTDLPFLECVNLTLTFDNLPVYIRDQLVRHRRTSVWSQTSRNNNDSAYFEGVYPDTIAQSEEASKVLKELYESSRNAYVELQNLGIPAEDARVVIPSGKLTALSWTFNIREMMRALGERSCFIAQGPWKEIICQIKEQMDKVKGLAIFAEVLGEPPCHYKKCIYSGENEQRRTGKDILPICPLYCKQCGDETYPKGQDMEYLGNNLNLLKRVWNHSVIDNLKKYVNK